MGLDVAYRIERERRQDEKRSHRWAVNRAKGEAIIIGTRERYLGRIARRLVRDNANPDTRLQVAEYAEVKIVIRQRKFSYTEHQAFNQVKATLIANPAKFEEEALDLSRYRNSLTDGEGAISVETFQYCLNVDPVQIIKDAANWNLQHSRNDPVVVTQD